VLDRNWRCAEGELDLVLKSKDSIVFCEVKARRTDAYGSGAEAVTRRKQQRLRVLAYRWLASHEHEWAALRFDVAEVTGTRITVIERAF
jgi:putative endonuclease